MTEIRRSFRLDEPWDFPTDTSIVAPVPAETMDSEDVMGSVLIVSNSKATCVAVDALLRDAVELLLMGGTLRDVLDYLDHISVANPSALLRTLLTNLELRNFHETARLTEVPTKAGYLHLFVTNACNLRCEHCYMSAGSPLAQGELTTLEQLKALDLFADQYPGGEVVFSGGEPLLSPSTLPLLRRANELGLRVVLFTNATLLDDDMAIKLIPLLDQLQVSLDGTTSHVNDSIRGPGSFDRIVSAIRLLDRYARDNSRLLMRIALTVTPASFEDIINNFGQLREALSLKGRHEFAMSGVSALGRAQDNPRFFRSSEHMEALVLRVTCALAEQGLYAFTIPGVNEMKTACGLGGVIGLGSDGSIYPCSMPYQPFLGNVRSEDAGEKFRHVQDFIAFAHVDNIEPCKDCSLRYLCGGLCRIANLKLTGSYVKCVCQADYKNSLVRTLIRRHRCFQIAGGLDE